MDLWIDECDGLFYYRTIEQTALSTWLSLPARKSRCDFGSSESRGSIWKLMATIEDLRFF